MNYIIAALIGIVVWQIICFIAYEVSKESWEILEYWALGFVVVTVGFVGLVYRTLRFRWCKKHLNGYRFYNKGTSIYMYYMTDKQAQKLYSEGENECYIIKCSEGCNWKSAPHKGEIYKGQEVFHGGDMKKYWKEQPV